MKAKFEGSDGRRLLIDALRESRLLQNDATAASMIADRGALVEFEEGATIIEQEATDDDVYFILRGHADVFVHNRYRGTRGARDTVGEMAAMAPAEPRSATVKAVKPTLCLKLNQGDFDQVAVEYPDIWRQLARVMAERLREKSQFIRPQNAMPILFIGSSAEGLEVLDRIVQDLDPYDIALRPWKAGIFGASEVPINDLLAEVENADFALFVFGPDDTIASRGASAAGPRDNVVFEMGLFMGRLGRQRVFMIKEKNTELKIPSDLTGVKPLTYTSKPGVELRQQIVPACADLREAMRAQGLV